MSEATYDDICDHLAELDEEVLLADGFEKALVGLVQGWFGNERRTVALYDISLCLKILVESGLVGEDGEDAEELAEEFFEFNVLGAYCGPGTPVFGTFFRPAPLAALS